MTNEELRQSLLAAPKNGFSRITAEQKVEMEQYCKGYMTFLDDCKTEREATTWTIAEAEKRGYEGELLDLYKQMKLEGRSFLKRVEDHVKFPVPLGREDECKHKVLVKNGSLLHKLTGSEEIYGATIHRYCVGEAAPDLEVIGRAEDGTIEAVQYGDKVLGIQFHAEADRMLPGIFKFLTGQE